MCFGGSQQMPTPAPVVDASAQTAATTDAAANAARRKALGLGDVSGTVISSTNPSLNQSGTGQALGTTS